MCHPVYRNRGDRSNCTQYASIFAVAHCAAYFVSPQEDDAGGDDGVGHERADAHHVDEVLQVEDLKRYRNDCAEFSQPLNEFTDRRHRAGEQPGEHRGHQRRLRPLVHAREEPAEGAFRIWVQN